ncbi:hypothetical protein GMST_19170 [Geomonas silvestris]|uniref:Glycosyltransferase RgtA/B/C/D-like domain-containing protein n=1 Tax=Geomonas silvestris TaxID=2740184 RepID=A0A6V8MI06_9BACT|nr:glycosyltransferase family 39 protein [Geomonas silvestris]GFO59592.1 hypothetical protein GMST_19170 [Geomonas silvestris]
MILCIVITAVMAVSNYYFLSKVSSESALNRVLVGFGMLCSQIILSELTLGLLGVLHASYLAAVNLAICLALFIVAYRKTNRDFKTVLDADLGSLKRAVADALDAPTVCLGILVAFAYSWVLVAAYYLPPRGIDDFAYHLPTIFEYIKSHEIRLLPVALRTHFAFPQNAELLFMWLAVFSKSQRMLSGLNVVFVFASIATLYALIRHFGISSKNALFAALLYALCPVVIMQAGGNYIDVIVALFLMMGIYFAILFHTNQKVIYLLATGMTIGLMCGMKYTCLAFAIPFQVLIIPGLWKSRPRYLIGYLFSILILCGWWYLRNFVVLGDPTYPLNLFKLPSGPPAGVSVATNIAGNLDGWWLKYPLYDMGVGSYDGGFGLVFWGIGISSWVYVTGRGLLHPGRVGVAKWTVLGFLPAGFFLMLTVPVGDAAVTGRFGLIAVAVALFALCELLVVLNDRAYEYLVKSACIILSFVTVPLMSVSESPSYRLGTVLTDRINFKHPSEFKYLKDSHVMIRRLVDVWAPLDFITREGRGLNCYLASDAPIFMSAPVFGSKLQNRVVNLSNTKEPVDAFVYTYLIKDGMKNHDAMKVDPSTTVLDIMSSDDFIVVTNSRIMLNGAGAGTSLMLHKNIFSRPETLQLLRKYYHSAWPLAAAAAQRINPALEENIPVVTSSEIGYGVRCIDMLAGRKDRMVMTPEDTEELVVGRKGLQRCYTIGKALQGFQHRQIASVYYNKSDVTIYLNWKR